jgi:hypothetical protein
MFSFLSSRGCFLNVPCEEPIQTGYDGSMSNNNRQIRLPCHAGLRVSFLASTRQCMAWRLEVRIGWMKAGSLSPGSDLKLSSELSHKFVKTFAGLQRPCLQLRMGGAQPGVAVPPDFFRSLQGPSSGFYRRSPIVLRRGRFSFSIIMSSFASPRSPIRRRGLRTVAFAGGSDGSEPRVVTFYGPRLAVSSADKRNVMKSVPGSICIRFGIFAVVLRASLAHTREACRSDPGKSRCAR